MSNAFRRVIVSQVDVARCMDFAKEFTSVSAKKSDNDFGHKKIQRESIDSIADSITGKIGEIAFQQICASLGFNIGLDFEINEGRHNIDFGQDVSEIEVNGNLLSPLINVDIKTSKGNSQWLLLETHKHWASVLVLMIANLAHDAESNLEAFNTDVECEYIGFAFLADFYDAEGVPWFEYKNGGRLIKPRYIEEMYEKALETTKKITLKSLITKHYNKEIKDEMFMGPSLKCPKQVGLPRKFLRSSERELIELLKFISDISVSKALATPEVIQSIVKLNAMLSTSPRILKIR